MHRSQTSHFFALWFLTFLPARSAAAWSLLPVLIRNSS
jgi:hypothetical protein